MRETMEEAGIDVRVTDLVAVEHTWSGDVLRLRYVVRAEPRGDLRPKASPTKHSLGAAWMKREDLARPGAPARRGPRLDRDPRGRRSAARVSYFFAS